ncbi:alpha/beta hydrolase [Aestuariivirga litoralis]|uniref:alpha/beta hydrolase n=1 Tax=Aestuariivirga litoralis TaxID=2650924 RepID=UPI0018C62F0D|nr:dienelactone hydrolase family protein [Aestuariivirga litoralis]MBG1233266.1 phospholipase [Aestuariivirga litoralis]
MTKLGAAVLKGNALESAKVICILSHGRGQSPEAMEDDILRRLDAPGVAFVLPRAAGKSWYDAKAVDALTEKTKAQLSDSLDVLRALVAELPAKTPVVMAGFSQGACLSIEYAMHFGPWNGALVAFTGCRVGTLDDERPAKDVTGLPAYISGSDADSWIPISAFSEAVQELGAARARVRADVFPLRGHEVSEAEISVLQNTLTHFTESAGLPW